jgi:hypothetical protein
LSFVSLESEEKYKKQQIVCTPYTTFWKDFEPDSEMDTETGGSLQGDQAKIVVE